MNDGLMENRIKTISNINDNTRTVLLIGSSYSEILLGCFGTILLHKKAGHAIRILIVSPDNEERNQSATTLKQLKESLGNIEDITFLKNIPSEYNHAVYGEDSFFLSFLKSKEKETLPDRIYVPYLAPTKTSELTIFEDVRQAIHDSMVAIDIALYEIEQTLPVNTLIDITEFKRKKEQIYLLCNKAPVDSICVNNNPQIMNDFRARTFEPNIGLVESFYLISSQTIHQDMNCLFSDEFVCNYKNSDRNKNPLVSVIIRTNNRPLLLKEAIISVFSQNYRPIELIVVNDGGQDVSEIVPQSGNAITCHYIDHGETKGRSAAANTGLQKAQGKYINLLDDDDLFYPHHIGDLVRYLEYNKFDAVYSDCELGLYYWAGHQYDLREKKPFLGEDFDLGKLFWNNIIPSMNIMFQRKIVDDIGFFDNTFKIYEDWDYWIRIGKRNLIHRLPGITAQYRQFENGSVGKGGRGYDFIYWTKLIQQKHFGSWVPEALSFIDFLKGNIQAGQEEINQYAIIVQDREKEIQKLSSIISQKEQETQKLSSVISQKEQEASKYTEIISNKEETIAFLNQEKIKAVSQQNELEASLGKKDRELQNIIQERQDTIQEIQHQRIKDIEHRENIINNHVRILKLQEERDDELAGLLNSYFLTNKMLINENKTLKYENKTLENENKTLKNENRILKNTNKTIVDKNSILYQNIELLNSQLDAYRQYDVSKVCRGARLYVDYRNKIHGVNTELIPMETMSGYLIDQDQLEYSNEDITESAPPAAAPAPPKDALEAESKTFYCPAERDDIAPLARLFSSDDLENPVLLQQAKDDQVPWEFKQDVPLLTSRILCLYLTCKTDNLARIEFIFGTHGRINIGKIVLCIWEDFNHDNLLRKSSVNVPGLLNNEFASFDFLPIPHSQEKLLYITLSYEDAPDDQFPSLWYGHIGNFVERQYYQWAQKMIPWQENDLLKMQKKINYFSYTPLISILMPVYKVEVKWLESAIRSVLDQAYQNWELLIVDDASNDEDIRRVLADFEHSDKRIKCLFLKENQGISNASNAALGMAKGEFTGLLDHDDLLTMDALFEVAAILYQYPDLDMIYSDEDKITVDGRRVEPFFKPDWSPDLLLSCMYTCHFSVYRTQLLNKIKGFRQGFEGSQDYDLVLRFTELTEKIHHIPKILYHWRKIPGSTASVYSNKGYARKAAMKSLTQALSRRQINGTVLDGLTDFSFRVKRAINTPPLVSIIIPFKDKVNLLKQCIDSIFKKTDYQNYEILCLNNNSTEKETIRYLEGLKQNKKIRRIDYEHPFNYSAINNFAVKHARGEILLLLNNDVEVIREDWMSSMLEHVQRQEVGVVGAQLLYPNDTIQHAGVMTGPGGIAGHAFKHIPIAQRTYYNGFPNMIRNVSCVTAACVMIRKEVFTAVGGFDEKNLKVAFNDVDLCLRIRKKGYQIIYTPFASLYHHESASRGHAVNMNEVHFIKQQWSEILLKDPFYSPNLTLDREDFTLNMEMLD